MWVTSSCYDVNIIACCFHFQLKGAWLTVDGWLWNDYNAYFCMIANSPESIPWMAVDLRDVTEIDYVTVLKPYNPCGNSYSIQKIWLIHAWCYLTYCGLVTPMATWYWVKLAQVWPDAWRHQAITWINVDLLWIRFCDIHIMAISQEITKPQITKIHLRITCLEFYSNLQGDNELT